MSVFSHRQQGRSYFYLSLGFIFLALSFGVRAFTKLAEREDLSGIYLSAPLLFLGMLSLLNAVRLSHIRSRDIFPSSTHKIYVLLILWSVITIIRDFSLDSLVIRDMWGISIFAWALLVPIIAVIGSDLHSWRIIIKQLFMFGWWGVLAFILTFIYFESPHDLNFAYGCLIILLFSSFLSFHNNRFYRPIILCGCIATLLTSILISSRSIVIEKSLFIFFAGLIYFFQKQKYRLRRRSIILLVAGGVLFLVNYVGTVDEILFLPSSVNEQINAFKEELPKNSRISEKHNIYLEFFDDVKGMDLLIGRGVMGEYYGYVGSKFREGGERKAIECGYFQIMLKGGIIMLVLIVFLSISAMWLAFFRSRNLFSKACAFIVLVRLIAMVPYGLPNANIDYVIFWMAIGACLSINIRFATDADISEALQPKLPAV